MKEGKIICIVCPVGCEIKFKVARDKMHDIKGNRCQRGLEYAKQEFYHPQRVLTTTVKVKEGRLPVVPVRTDRPVPRKMLTRCMRYLARIELTAPVKRGQVIVSDILGSGANVISSRNLGAKGCL